MYLDNEHTSNYNNIFGQWTTNHNVFEQQQTTNHNNEFGQQITKMYCTTNN
jgi:hypothetical protein